MEMPENWKIFSDLRLDPEFRFHLQMETRCLCSRTAAAAACVSLCARIKEDKKERSRNVLF